MMRRSWWIGLAILAGLGASPPEVVRVRVPASKVAAWFPAGSELEVLPRDRFEELVRAAFGQAEAPRAPRVLRARHSARWESGLLIGRSELVVEPPGGSAPAPLALVPWSPALTRGGTGSDLARSAEDGRLSLKLAPDGPRSVTLEWQLRARPGSGGRAFALALPEIELASMSLDLPADLHPEGNLGGTIGPEPGASADRLTWQIPAARGRLALRLRGGSGENPAGSPRHWLEGPTRIDLDASPATWKADWRLDESPGAPPRLTIELDPGLELVDVSGPRVGSFLVEPGGPPTRVAIRLEGEGTGPSPLTIRAIGHAPSEGIWTVPSARPVDAIWTGGRTTVRLGSTRVLQSCAERGGHRVAARAGESSDLPSMVFEPDGSGGPLADLTFRKPTAHATVAIRGHLRIGDDVPRVDVALSWTVEKGRLLVHAVDLPAGWTPDRVATAAGDPVDWHADDLPGGGSRVQIRPPIPDGEPRTLSLTLVASARGAGVSGPIDLPRVRPAPATARVVDEVWVATTAPGLAFRPSLGRGLAWIDPPDPASDGVPAPWASSDLAGALAWRWLVDDAEAQAVRSPIREVPRSDVRLDASVDRGRLGLDWSVAVGGPEGRPTSVPVHLDVPIDGPIRWRIAGPGGTAVEARPLDEAGRAEHGFPSSGAAFEVDLSGPRPGRVELKAHAEGPWSGAGRLPLLRLPGTHRTHGLVAIRVEDTARLRVEQSGLTPIDLSESTRDAAGPPEDPARDGEPGHRRVTMFGYRDAAGRLKIKTTPGEVGPTGGVVREAWLTTQVHPGAGLRHRLTLRVAINSARDVVLTMPRGVTLDRLRRDGQPTLAIPDGRSFRVAIPAPGPGRPTTTLTLDYRTEEPPSDRLDPLALLPGCSLPCLSFAWEVVTPEPWTLGQATGGLVEADPHPARTWTSTLLGLGSVATTLLERRGASVDRLAILGELDKSVEGQARGETSLGDWLVKLDSGRWPMVVDRLAMLSAGWGPSSHMAPGSGSAGLPGSVEATLQGMGLEAVPLDGVVLITSRAASPGRSTDPDAPAPAWSIPVRLASAIDADEVDRFQSVSRWRGEATPRVPSAGEAPERSPGPVGWRTARFVGIGWPAPGGSTTLIDGRAESGRGWLVAALLLAIGIVFRARPVAYRAIAIGLATAGFTLAIARTWPDPPSWATGGLRGLLAVLACGLGRWFRPDPAGRDPAPGDASMTRPVGLGVLVPSILVAIAAGVLVSMATAAGPDSGSAILALLPFDGPADPLAEPGRVVMLLADGDRLRRLAESGSARGPARVWLVDADHHVTREGPDHAVVESRYEIEVEGQGSAGWSVPVGSARDLSATVDDRPTPLAIAPDGTAATLAIEGPGVHSLRLRRSVPLRTEGAGAGPGRFRLPINRAAFARVEVSGETRGFRVEVPVAAGQVEAIPEGMGGAIGPVEALEVRWSAMDRTAARDLAGPVEAKMLWDARPVGDLLRIRLTHSDPEGASTIRLAPEPGLVVRSFSIPDVVAISREGPPGRPEWVAHVDPPWPRDIPIEVVLWRPHSPDQGPRRLPRVELPGSRRLSGSVGLRRPGDWSGRLEPVDGAEPLPESSFARSWGPLPSDGLTLAGSVRFGRLPELGVAIGPLPLRRTVRPRVQVEFEPGRLNTSIDAVLSDQQGRSFAIEMGMPTDFRVVRVEAGGMLDWQKVARDRLRIQFDGSEARDRPIRVQGYLPAPSDPALAETRTYRAPIPWPRWSEAVAEAGTLVVSGPGRFQLDLGEGIAPLSPAGPVEVGASSRSYRVDRPGGLGPVQWSSPRARVGVSVRSDLTIDPGHVTWTAVIDCDVTGGPSEALQWNLPTEWAQTAQLEVAGLPRLPEAETRGRITSWKVALDPPIWGRTRLVIRSRLPVRPGVAFDFPEVAPMALPGRGSVGRYDLAMANVSGRPIEVGGSPGLQAIDASRYRSDESPAPPGSIDRAYRVTGDRWSLRVTVGGADDRTRGHPGGESTRLARARLRGTIGPTGETWGLASYDLGPRPGPFLALRLPEGVDVPWASVDGSVTPGLRDGPGRWMIPLRDREARRVELCWHAPPRRGVPEGPLTVAWPITDPPELPTLFRLFAPRSIDVASLPGGLERIDRREWEVEEAEQLARRIGDALSNFDRGSRRRRVEIIRDVVAFELGDRALRRTPVPPSAGTEADGARLRSARDSITEAGQGAGLEDLIQDARSRVGLGPGLGEPEAEGRIGPVEPTRIRRIGVAHHFRGEGPGSGRARRITWAPRPLTPWWQARSAWLIASLGLMIASALGWLVARPIPVSRRSAGAALSAVALVLLALEPQGTALVLAVVALGRSIE